MAKHFFPVTSQTQALGPVAVRNVEFGGEKFDEPPDRSLDGIFDQRAAGIGVRARAGWIISRN